LENTRCTYRSRTRCREEDSNNKKGREKSSGGSRKEGGGQLREGKKREAQKTGWILAKGKKKSN